VPDRRRILICEYGFGVLAGQAALIYGLEGWACGGLEYRS
jgi:hypothetical protein